MPRWHDGAEHLLSASMQAFTEPFVTNGFNSVIYTKVHHMYHTENGPLMLL